MTFNGLGKVVEPDKESGVKKENKQIVLSFIQLPDNTKESDMKMKPGVSPFSHILDYNPDGIQGKIVNAPGKSIWRGRDKEEVSVEIFALQHYEDKDFKGYVKTSYISNRQTDVGMQLPLRRSDRDYSIRLTILGHHIRIDTWCI